LNFGVSGRRVPAGASRSLPAGTVQSNVALAMAQKSRLMSASL
jgi:hypothetical protein